MFCVNPDISSQNCGNTLVSATCIPQFLASVLSRVVIKILKDCLLELYRNLSNGTVCIVICIGINA